MGEMLVYHLSTADVLFLLYVIKLTSCKIVECKVRDDMRCFLIGFLRKV